MKTMKKWLRNEHQNLMNVYYELFQMFKEFTHKEDNEIVREILKRIKERK